MLKKGDLVSITYRTGYDKKGNPIMETLDRCVVDEINGANITVSHRVIGKGEDGRDQVEIHTQTFNIKSPDFVGVKPAAK